jgi:plastocyanin
MVAGTMVMLAGCGGGGGKDEKIDTSRIGVQQNTTAQASAEQIIEVKDGSFSPDTVTIKAGTKVVWKWTANVPCSLLMSGSAAPEQSSGTYERLFSTGGSTYSYQCAGKPAMAGKITVE